MTVTTAQAELCASFILDQQFNGESVSLPDALAEAVMCYERATAGIDAGISDLIHPAVIEEVREQIERWYLVDPDACVGLLGPGLGIDQEPRRFNWDGGECSLDEFMSRANRYGFDSEDVAKVATLDVGASHSFEYGHGASQIVRVR